MKKRAFEIRAAYSIPELAEMANLHRHKLRRILESAGIVFRKQGRLLLVETGQLMELMPKFWAGIVGMNLTMNNMIK